LLDQGIWSAVNRALPDLTLVAAQPDDAADADRGGDPPGLLAGRVDQVEADLAGESDPGPVGRPGRRGLVFALVRQPPQLAPVRTNRPDLPGGVVRLGDADEGRRVDLVLGRRRARTADRGEGDAA